MITLTTNNLLVMKVEVSSHLDLKWNVGVNPRRERIIGIRDLEKNAWSNKHDRL